MFRCRELPLPLPFPRLMLGVAGLAFALGLHGATPVMMTPLAPRSGPRHGTLFVEIPPAQSGVRMDNGYRDPAMWVNRYAEFATGSIGSGVAIGDYNGDGRPDLFVVSKVEPFRLFRNLGQWSFEDVTAKAGLLEPDIDAPRWKQGATFVDVNNDGWLDLYVCRFNAPNLLYVNQRDGTFREEAATRGLAITDGSVMAAFADYDRDGWLDVFIVTNQPASTTDRHPQRTYLLHNDSDGRFSDVTAAAGVDAPGQGHSCLWWDYDEDGWPDLYVTNDFTPPDHLYRNNHDGTFTDVIQRTVPLMPFSSMGSDIGDVNNDGHVDLLVADMAATSHEKDQRTMAVARTRLIEPARDSASVPFVMRNALYLNAGGGRLLEAAFLTGIAATDWTWSPRFEDLDNDGWIDLHVTNGMYREPHNADLMDRIARADSIDQKIRLERASPTLSEANLAFRNVGGLRFENVSTAWGLDQKGVSFGAALGDLDGDGDLDLVFTNYQHGPTLLRNDSESGHRVLVELRGVRSNRFGIGAVVRLETADHRQVRPLLLARGYTSSSEPVVHFGTGDETVIRRLTIEWPSGAKQEFKDLAVDQKYTITEPAQAGPIPPAVPPQAATQFTEVSAAARAAVVAREAAIDETSIQPLLPFRQNRRGPALAVAESGGRDIVAVGGTTRDPRRLLTGNAGGIFTVQDGPAANDPRAVNDGPVLLFAADGNDTPDFLVTKAGVASPAGSAAYQPQLYLNGDKGGWTSAAADALPPFPVSVGAVTAADFDHDGRLDVFLGGRVQPGLYPSAPRSALWRNLGGRFEDVTEQIAPAWRELGLVTSAVWCDVDRDGWPDLVVALEWGQVRYFHNQAGRQFEDRTREAGFASAGTGWWTSLAAADFNGDGRPDFILGNVGLNTQYHATDQHPALLYAGDFAGDGNPQLIEAYYEGDKLYPWRTRKDLGAVIPSVLKKYPRNDYYARATLPEILGQDKLDAAQRYAATELQSGVLLSDASGHYHFEPLPRLAQIAPMQGIAIADFDGDGHLDCYAVQNSFAPVPVIGRFSGGLSQLLRGDGHGHFTPVPSSESGLVVPGDAKAVIVLDGDHDGWPDLFVSRNDDTTLLFRNRPITGHTAVQIRLHGRGANPNGIGGSVTVTLADGSSQTQTIQAGSSYYSQSAPAAFFGWSSTTPAQAIAVRWPDGAVSKVPVPTASGSVTVSEKEE